LGVLYKNKQVGQFGISSAFSMQSNKVIDAGEGGVLCTNDDEVMTRSVLYSGCYEANYIKHNNYDDLKP